MKKLITIVVLLIAIGAAGAFYYANRGEKEPTITTLKTSRGDIVDGVGATGTLQAVTTVTVGTQVSGIVQELNADFNSIVKKGQVIARLDPSILETQVETAKANLVNANANLERQRVALADAQTKFERAKELNAKQLTTKVDLENAEVAVKSAQAQLKSTESQIVQAEAAVNKAKVDLDHTIITAPINGIVIKRSVDKGQTVAASMSAPELFIIAADLTQMQVNANIDESDVGRIRPGEAVTFRVDAYPTDTFHGTVRQVRLNPTTVQNVVTYSTVIDVPNPDYRLTPGMTANVVIEIARRANALRIPNAALRFRPTKEIFEALHQPMPAELERGFGRGPGGQRNAGGPGSGGAGTPSAPAANATPGAPTAQNAPQGSQPRPAGTGTAGQAQATAQNNQQNSQRQNRSGGDQPARDGQPDQSARQNSGQGGGQGQGGRGGAFSNMTPEERQKRMQERMASMTPEERAQFEERMRQRQANGGGRGSFGGGQGQGQGNFQRNNGGGNGGGGSFQGRTGNGATTGGGNRTNAGQPSRPAPSKPAADPTTIDAMFAPIQFQETRGRVWLYVNKELKLVNLRLGITDGTYTEVLNEDALQPDQDVVTQVITADMANRPAGQQQNNQNNNNPLLPQRGGRGGPGGGGGGGGRGR